MHSLTQDLRFALRRLRKSPGFAATAILTLALGIGATTAIFTLIYQVILRSLPVTQPAQLYMVGKDIQCCVSGGTQDDWSLFSLDLYRYLRDHSTGIDSMAAVQASSVNVAMRRPGESGVALPLRARLVSGNYFTTLGVRVLAGRLLSPQDDDPAAPAAAVLSYALWQANFHADPALVGSTLLLSGHPVTVVGITAPGFYGERNEADPSGLWMPIAQEPLLEAERNLVAFPGAHWLDIIARVSDKTQLPRAQLSIQRSLLEWLRANPALTQNAQESVIARQTTELAPAAAGINNLADNFGSSLKLLLLAAAFVLLIACANLANLLLVRGMGRAQEIALRSAIGAPRSRIIREMFVEAILLATLGGIAAIAVAYAGTRAILALAMPAAQISPITASPSLTVIAFALFVAMLTGVLFGTAPALIASRVAPADTLRGANRGTRAAGAGPQRTLVIFQAALSLALLSSAGLLIRSLRTMQDQDPHFHPESRLIAFLDLQAAGYSAAQLPNLYRRIDGAFTGDPRIQNFTYATYSPMAFNNFGGGIAFPGGDPNAQQGASYTAVSADYFATVGTRILAGRPFADSDTATSRHVAIVNHVFVHKYLHDMPNPIGQNFGPDGSLTSEWEIVGVADDTRYGEPTADVRPMYFTPLTQSTDYSHIHATEIVRQQANQGESYKHFASNLVIHYHGDSAQAAALVREKLKAIDPAIALLSLKTYNENISGYFTNQELLVRLTTLFALLALLLATIGLYGVTAYTVARRTNEIGIRMALGATRTNVLTLILRSALGQVAIGLLIGIPLTFAAARLLQHTLYRTSAFQPAILLTVIALMAVFTLIAAALPARRAASIEPNQALRSE